VIHVVYGDDHESPKGTFKPFIRYTYNNGGSWPSATRLDSAGQNNGNRYPTISLDASTGNVYVFWVDISSMNVVAKRNSSGTWESVDIGTQTSNAKQYLTSIYSAPGPSSICWQWTQNTTSPIDVVFDKIPEFEQLTLPVGFMVLAIVLTFRRARISRRRT